MLNLRRQARETTRPSRSGVRDLFRLGLRLLDHVPEATSRQKLAEDVWLLARPVENIEGNRVATEVGEVLGDLIVVDSSSRLSLPPTP